MSYTEKDRHESPNVESGEPVPDVDTKDNANRAEQEEKDETALPSALRELMVKQYLVAAAIAIVSIVLVVTYKTPQSLIGFIISGALVILAISTKHDYFEGKINEECLMCTTVTPLKAKNACRVIFRNQDEVPRYFEFIVPDKKQNQLIENQVYVVYFRDSDPKNLLGYKQL